MSITDLMPWIVGAGALGGLVNGLLVDNTFGFPKNSPPAAGVQTGPPHLGGWALAILVNIFFGVVASWLSWAMYGPLSGCPLFGEQPKACLHPELTLTLSALATAVVVGVAGPRWITNEYDKKLLKDAAAEAMTKEPNAPMAHRITAVGPAEVLRLVRSA